MSDLGTLPGVLNTEANFINSKSQVVGDAFACDFSVFTATLWENGSIVDLNTLIPANSPLYLFMASFIDDRGLIAAFGFLPNFDMHAVLLIPCEEYDDDSQCRTENSEKRADARANALLPERVRQLLRRH